MSDNIQLTLAGSQSGYSVTWGTVTTGFEGGSAIVTMNYFDGSSSSFGREDIRNLSGITYNGVVSIVFNTISNYNTTSGYNGEIVGDFSLHSFYNQNGSPYGFSTEGSNFIGSHYTCITLTLGADLYITSFYIWGID